MTRLLAPIVALAFLFSACAAPSPSEETFTEQETVTETVTEQVEAEVVTETVEVEVPGPATVPESCLLVADNLEFLSEWSYEYTTAVAAMFKALAAGDMTALEKQIPVILDLNERIAARADRGDIQGILPDCRAGR